MPHSYKQEPDLNGLHEKYADLVPLTAELEQRQSYSLRESHSDSFSVHVQSSYTSPQLHGSLPLIWNIDGDLFRPMRGASYHSGVLDFEETRELNEANLWGCKLRTRHREICLVSNTTTTCPKSQTSISTAQIIQEPAMFILRMSTTLKTRIFTSICIALNQSTSRATREKREARGNIL